MGLESVPVELRKHRQFVVWKLELVWGCDPQKPEYTKVPYNALVGTRASVTDPTSWCTYDEAMAVVAGYSGLGFILTDDDEFTFIDLDFTTDPERQARQALIYNQFDSYSERSPSGKGLHIIVKGKVPQGRRRESVEIYSNKRFMTLTGDVFNNKPIANRQELITILYNEMTRSNGVNVNLEAGEPERDSDEDIVKQGSTAPINGERFQALFKGEWRPCGYPSQSEADYAFIDMLANYTKNKDQIRRLFWLSGLGQRPKAKRMDYLNSMVDKAFDRVLGPMDFSNFGKNIPQEWQNENTTPHVNGVVSSFVTNSQVSVVEDYSTDNPDTVASPTSFVKRPPGLLGAMADFIYRQSPRPVVEMAMCGALALLAGIVGRQYNTPSGAGLNLYLVLVAKTATGKEGMSSGISKLFKALKKQVAAIDDFRGPSMIASGAALLRKLEKQECCLSILGEFGHLIQTMCHEKAPSHLVNLRAVLLDVYTKSGRGNVIAPSIYSEKEKTIADIHEPALTILGESTPSSFYEQLDEAQVAMGLIARLLIVEYHGDRVSNNPNVQFEPPPDLVTQLGGLASYCLTNAHNGVVIDVKWSRESYDLGQKFDHACDTKVRSGKTNATRDLWGRGYLMAMKVASLYAVAENAYIPTISAENWIMAEELVTRCIANIAAKFSKGEMGKAGEPIQLQLVKRETAKYIKDWLQPKRLSTSYKINQKMLDDGIIPFTYYASKLANHAAFNTFGNHPKGSIAIKQVLKNVCDLGLLAEVEKVKRYVYGSDRLMFQIRELPKTEDDENDKVD